MRKQIAFVILLAACEQVLAQDSVSAPGGRLSVLEIRHPWLQTANAAGLSEGVASSLGETYAGFEQERGDFHRPQEPLRSTRFRFVSQKYQQLEGMRLYGKFAFTQAWEQSIRMSNVLNPYRRNPYILADSLGGDWKKQWYDLTLKAATAPLLRDRLVGGLGLTYQVGTGARQNDPRPANYSNEIGLTPSLLWILGSSLKAGVNGRFEFFKENVSMAVSNTEDVHYMYRLAGLGRYYRENLSAGSYARHYNGRTNGVDLQLSAAPAGWQWLLTGGYALRTEEATDGSTLTRNTGTLREKQYRLSGVVQRFAGAHTHQWNASWTGFAGEGTDFHLIQDTATRLFRVVNDDVLTTTYYNQAAFTYRLLRNRQQNDYHWLLEAGVTYSGMDNRVLVPQLRQTVDALEYRLAYRNHHVLGAKSSLQWGFEAAWRDCFTGYTDFQPSKAQTSVVVDQYFIPDQAWLSADWFRTGVSAEYSFPLSAKGTSSWFVRGTYKGMFPGKKDGVGYASGRTAFGLSVGVLY